MIKKTAVSEKSQVSRQNLKNPDVLEALKTLNDLTSSSIGQHGKMKILQNQSGGHITITSSSKRLLCCLSITKPIIQLLVSSAQGHIDAYKDGGLFLLSLASSLVRTSIKSDLNCRILSEIYEKFLTVCVEYLNSDECACKVHVVLSDIKFMKSCVRSVVQAKPLCRLNEEKLDLISRLLIEAFLTGVSETESNVDNVHIIGHEDKDALQSKLVSGLMLNAPELSRYKIIKFNFKRQQTENNRIKVALVTVSMSGDLEEMPDVQLEVWNGLDLDTVLVEQDMKFCEQMVKCGVNVLLCQKVVHPKLKLELRRSGILVVDRLGLNIVGTVCKISGAAPIRSLLTTVSESSFGWLDGVDHVIEHGQSYLLLTREATPVSTLILCHQEEEMLEELKDVCTTALHSLRLMLYSPSVLFGGGCWQVMLAQYLRNKVKNEKEAFATELECSQTMLTKSCELFTHALQMAAIPSNHRNQYYFNYENGHFYLDEDRQFGASGSEMNMCSCKFHVGKTDKTALRNVCLEKMENPDINFIHFSTKDVTAACQSRYLVLDNFAMCLNALKTAILTASTVLKIGQVISNI